MPSRCTAQLVVSANEAYVAYSDDRAVRGPSGEVWIARLLHTEDGGSHWRLVPWRRTVLAWLFRPAFPTWPPEAVLSLRLADRGLAITHRDEWIPFESGGESLWESTFDGRRWRVRKLHAMNYTGGDNPAVVPEIPLTLPTTVRHPDDEP